MPVEITKAQIAELRGLLAKATPGPWGVRYAPHRDEDCIVVGPRPETMAYAPCILAEDYTGFGGWPVREADHLLVVAMRNGLPALLDAAERAETAREDALKKATKIAQGDTVHEIFREWPWLGNRARDSEITRHSDAIANAILALIDNPKGGDANARSDDSQSKPALHATSPGVTAGASVVEDDLCGRLRVYALAEDIMSSERRDLETAATRIRSLSAQLAEARREKDTYREAFGCLSCGEDHPVESMCPPHEVRSSGMGSHRQQIGKAVARATASEAQAAALRERVWVLEKALEPFAEAATKGEIGGYPPNYFVGATEFENARRACTALEGRS